MTTDTTTETLKVVIGFTAAALDRSYVPQLDGYRPGALQQEVELHCRVVPTAQHTDYAEGVFEVTNAPYLPTQGAAGAVADAVTALSTRLPRTLSVGDTVTVGDVKLACLSAGWAEVQ